MIKANELRLGNLVLFNGKQKKITPNDITYQEYWLNRKGTNTNKPEETIQPIPLTEDWLLKFGFELNESIEEDDDNFHYKALWLSIPNKYTFEMSKFIGDDNRVREDEKNIELGDNPLPHIKHVHQLQNLYFALTGEELTINK